MITKENTGTGVVLWVDSVVGCPEGSGFDNGVEITAVACQNTV